MPLIHLDDPADPRLAPYQGVSDRALLERQGLFMVEGRLVVRRLLLESRLHAASVLVTPNALAALADIVPGRAPDLPVFVVPQRVMNAVSGFNMHRGCLATGIRAPGARVEDLLHHASSRARVLLLEQVSNPDNVGGIFRCAAALGGEAIVLGPGCGDPLYRKAIRTSIGCTLTVPFAATPSWPSSLEALRARGFTLVALTPAREAQDVRHAADGLRARRVALLLGAEGDGLSPETIAAADLRVRIAMAAGADSLNVSVAAGIALHALGTNVADDPPNR
jgi:tRNA G18 (ribose-2'-O)-methylase SpoU